MAKKIKKKLALTIAKYEKFVSKSLKAKKPNRNVLVLGLVSEIGSVYSNIKKRLRDEAVEIIDKKDLIEEIGDSLWYMTAICCEYKLKINEVLLNNLKNIQENPNGIIKHSSNSSNFKLPSLKGRIMPDNIEFFGEYEKLGSTATGFTKCRKNDRLFQYCYVINILGNDVFNIFHGYKENEKLNKDDKTKLIEKLGYLFWCLSAIANHCRTSISEVAIHNENKVKELFMTKISDLKKEPLYDDSRQYNSEKLPREMTVYFYNNEQKLAYIVINSIALGDPLSDNYEEDDGYRYHDGIHFVIYALLGWSPVWRGFLKKKRKSNKKIDEAQDGARAKIVEEMIVKMIHSYFEEISGGLDTINKKTKYIKSVNTSFLKNIKILTKRLEIENISYAQWEEIIIKSQEIYYKLRINKGGKLIINLKNRNIKYKKLLGENKEFSFKKCD